MKALVEFWFDCAHLIIQRCVQCQSLITTIEDLADTPNEMEDEGITFAKVDCSTERALCPGNDSS